MENEMETAIVYWGYIGSNGKQHGDYYLGRVYYHYLGFRV